MLKIIQEPEEKSIFEDAVGLIFAHLKMKVLYFTL